MEEVFWRSSNCSPSKFYLIGGNEYSRSGCKPDYDGLGNVANNSSESQDSEYELNESGEEG